eukprot:10858843-Alexandrium_andersonii.AAC.1
MLLRRASFALDAVSLAEPSLLRALRPLLRSRRAQSPGRRSQSLSPRRNSPPGLSKAGSRRVPARKPGT